MSRRPAYLLSLCILACVSAHAGYAPIETGRHADHDDHAALPHDPTLSLAAATRAALLISTDQSLAQARLTEARTLSSRGGSLIAGSPALMMRYQDDRWQSQTGLREMEAGLELPLWRPGQRSAIASEGRDATAYAEGNEQLRGWLVAGQVRESFWQERLAAWLADRARIDVEAWKALEQDVLKRIRAGDAAPADRLVVENARRERELILHEAEVMHIDSEFQWRVLTGLERMPADGNEDIHDGDQVWPPLRQARLWLARQQDAYESLKAQGAGNPRLLLSGRRETLLSTNVDSVGATLTLPFGGGSHQRANLIGAGTLQAEAQDAVRRNEREAMLVRHEASHELEARREALALLDARLALSRSEVELSRKAYRLGETSLTERLLSEQRHADVERQQGAAVIALARAVARYNQAQGILP